MERKDLTIIILAIVLIFSSIGNGILAFIFTRIDNKEYGEIIKVVSRKNPFTMDPCNSWDSNSNNVFNQVLETLLAYDLTDPKLPIIGRLAESWDFQSSKFGTNITFQLRDEVYFHDGSKLTGECVLHTFERINFFGNATGTLDPDLYVMAAPHSLYKFPNKPPELTPIFNHTLSFINPMDELEVTLVLNAPFAPVEGLLAYSASSIVHPDSTPADRMLVLGKDLVIGTGPFKLVKYVPNSEVRFSRWERYWRTGAYFDSIVYIYYRNDVTANNAMLSGDIDWLGQGIASLKAQFEADPDITVTGDGIHAYINDTKYHYIEFNNEIINVTWRKAISYAFNYSYLIKEIQQDTVVRAHSLVPPGFPAHNASVKAANYDIPKARQYMQKMGYGYTAGVPWQVGSQLGDKFFPGSDENLWKAAEFIPTTNASGWTLPTANFSNNAFNFWLELGDHFMELLIQRFTEDMDLIGIKIIPQLLSWDQLLDVGLNHRERLHLYYIWWGPDYFETFNMIDPLVNPDSSMNFGGINEAEITTLLAVTAAETDTLQRYEYYKKLQYLIHDKYFCQIPLMYFKLYHVHASDLKGFPYNVMRLHYWYLCYRE
ncbi:MAG: ABC transporter substrate-binding protein [Candidatus Hermodarchaeota archaeon]